MLAAAVIVKVISAVYKIPLTNYIGATGRGYFSVAYNLCMPIHALTMGAFPLALTRLVSTYEAKGDRVRLKAIRKASKKLFFIIGMTGLFVMFAAAKPYSQLIASSPKSIYTVLALAPSVFFSCLCACHRAFAEGFLDMKATAFSQTIEALFKMVFGLLFARLSMSSLYSNYAEYGTVLGIAAGDESQALSMIYPITSASAMLGVTLGTAAGWLFAAVYTNSKYRFDDIGRIKPTDAYDELLSFSAGLVGATVVQSLANFFDTSSIQYCLSLCSDEKLASIYNVQSDDIYTYVLGIYSVALDFKNLVPSAVMALGVTAVPAVNTAYESGQERFSPLLNSIFKYTAILGCLGGTALALFYNDLLLMFYGDTNSDIVNNAGRLLFAFAVTSLPCAAASTCVYCTQALGYATATILPFCVSAVIRIAINFIMIPVNDINIYATALSNFVGFTVILVWNMIIIHKKTKARFSLSAIFLKPVLCSVITYFVTFAVRNIFFGSGKSLSVFILSALLCLFIYIVLLFLTGSLSSSEIKLFNLGKKTL